jgi:hypothetical protein
LKNSIGRHYVDGDIVRNFRRVALRRFLQRTGRHRPPAIAIACTINWAESHGDAIVERRASTPWQSPFLSIQEEQEVWGERHAAV